MPPRLRSILAVGAALLLAACAPAPEAVKPALWQVDGPRGERAWLLGTIHALPASVAWRSPAIDTAIGGSDRLLLEIADDGAAVGAIFKRLSRSPGLPPVLDRVSAKDRPRLAALLKEFGLKDGDLRETETWAAALTLSQHAQGEASARYGIEAEIRKAARGKPVDALEGAAAQLGLFDRLPEQDQRDLLAAVIDEASAPDRPDTLGNAWKRGDMAAIDRETRTGMMADPELRAALLTARNHAWAEQLTLRLAHGQRPLVAVGAAHMAGADGLPALLAARGFAVRRLQ